MDMRMVLSTSACLYTPEDAPSTLATIAAVAVTRGVAMEVPLMTT